MSVTIVSCFYVIKSKFPCDKYLEWTDNFMKLKFNRVVFCDTNSFNILNTKYNDKNTIYKILEFSDFYTSNYNWDYDYDIDIEKVKGHTIELYKIWNEKIHFINRVIDENPFKSEYFMWLDIGCFRNKNVLNDFLSFPSYNAFIPNKIIIPLIYKYDDDIKKNINDVDCRFRHKNYIGGLFAGDIQSLRKFKNKHIEMLEIFKKNKIFAGKDQSIYNFIVLQNTHLFHLLNAHDVHPNYDPWFCFHYYFCNK